MLCCSVYIGHSRWRYTCTIRDRPNKHRRFLERLREKKPTRRIKCNSTHLINLSRLTLFSVTHRLTHSVSLCETNLLQDENLILKVCFCYELWFLIKVGNIFWWKKGKRKKEKNVIKTSLCFCKYLSKLTRASYLVHRFSVSSV